MTNESVTARSLTRWPLPGISPARHLPCPPPSASRNTMSRPANPALPHTLAEAAVAIFADHGLAAARVADITDRAGTSKGAFYLHFESKEALYLQLCRAFFDDLRAEMQRYEECLCATFYPDFLAQVAAKDAALCEFLWRRRAELAMVIEGAAATPYAFLADEFLDLIEQVTRASMLRHHELLPESVRDGLDPDFGALMATGIMFMYARRMLRAEVMPDMAAQIARFRRLIAMGLMLHGVHPDELGALPVASESDASTRPPATLAPHEVHP
ncbi:MAG: TetR/AcrR family transcriptional regulator [Myxococcales bacterium]|nr:TetR/AcrR family transcriptional regulator [Myxococcales bacterium]